MQDLWVYVARKTLGARGDTGKMVDFKLVIGGKDGKTHQVEVKSPQADSLLKSRIGETVSGDDLGFAGYEFQITGGSDKSGFPMRKGIQEPRKMIFTHGGVGFSGKRRFVGKKRNVRSQKGLLRKRTVCGEMITKIIRQVNLKVLKEGAKKLGEADAPAEQASEEQASPAEK